MGFFGGDSSTTVVQTNYQTTNVGVTVNPQLNFGPQFLTPLAQTLGEINQGIVDRFEPIAKDIRGTLDNTNRLAGDLRRTADFSPNPAAAPPSPTQPSMLLLGMGAVLLGVLLSKTL